MQVMWKEEILIATRRPACSRTTQPQKPPSDAMAAKCFSRLESSTLTCPQRTDANVYVPNADTKTRKTFTAPNHFQLRKRRDNAPLALNCRHWIRFTRMHSENGDTAAACKSCILSVEKTVETRVKIVIKRAKERLLEVEPTHVGRIIGIPCFYFAITEPEMPMTVDRVDPHKGYMDGNMVSACWPCNRAKSNCNRDRFLWKMSQINHHNEDRVSSATDDLNLIAYGRRCPAFTRDVPYSEVDKRVLLTAAEVVDLWCSPCTFCGRLSFGIDRHKPGSDGGLYCKENCGACCSKCNWAKAIC